MNLGVWRSNDIDSKILRACQLNREKNLWPKFEASPPLLVTLGGDRFDKIDASLYADGLGYKSGLRISQSATILHWNGARKPWLKDGMYKQLWSPYDIKDVQQVKAVPGAHSGVAQSTISPFPKVSADASQCAQGEQLQPLATAPNACYDHNMLPRRPTPIARKSQWTVPLRWMPHSCSQVTAFTVLGYASLERRAVAAALVR